MYDKYDSMYVCISCADIVYLPKNLKETKTGLQNDLKVTDASLCTRKLIG